jgi:hypothetical protein
MNRTMGEIKLDKYRCNFDNMPREELIAEIKTWQNKFSTRIDELQFNYRQSIEEKEDAYLEKLKTAKEEFFVYNEHYQRYFNTLDKDVDMYNLALRKHNSKLIFRLFKNLKAPTLVRSRVDIR